MPKTNLKSLNLQIQYVPISIPKPSEYNPRKWSDQAIKQLKESMQRFDLVEPLILNSASNRKNILIGGHFRLKIAKELGYKAIPAIYVRISNLEKEKELNIRLNKNVGEFDLELLKGFDEAFLSDTGFSSEDLDKIFDIEENPEVFDLEKELRKLDIKKVQLKKGDLLDLDGSRLLVGDSTIESDMLKLFGKERANFCLTDPPYLLDYLHGKKKKNSTAGFGLKRDRTYLGTEVLPENFTQLWMENIAQIQKPDFSIIVYENPKNLRTIWNELEKHWKYRNTIIWHLPNRVQGFAAKYKFFNKYDFAILGTSGDVSLNEKPESNALLQEDYESALFATSGKPTWEKYEKGKKYCPTDFIEYKASDAKSSGQGIIFGTKPIEILIPYIKVLTKRGDIIAEPFSGSGSTLIAATKLKRRCFGMEKSPVYAEVIRKRWENLTGKKARPL